MYSAASFGRRSWRIPGSGAREVRVGLVLSERLPQLRQVRSDLASRHIQERTNQGDLRIRGKDSPPRDSRQPAETGAADDSMENRLGLIVARVPDHYGRGATSPSDLDQPVIPGSSCLGLEVPGADWPPPAEVERQAERRGQLGHEAGIGPRCLTPRTVVQVSHREAKIHPRRELVQDTQEPDAITTSRDGNHPRGTQAPGAPSCDPSLDLVDPGSLHGRSVPSWRGEANSDKMTECCSRA